MKKLFSACAFALAAIAAVTTHAAEPWPSKPIRFVVPFTAGGSADLMARLVGQQLSAKYGQTVVIDNRPGAGGHIGAEAVANAAPDGYTWVLGTSGVHAAYAMYPKLRYDPSKKLTPVTLIGEFPNVLVVHPSVPAQNIQEFLALAKAKPGTLNFGSAGNGSSTHLSAELFKQVAGINVQHVPYRGSSAAMNDLMGGQIQFMLENLPTTLSMIQSGKVRALGVTSRKTADSLPGVPSISDSLPSYDFTAWMTLAVPAGTPPEIIQKINADVAEAVHSPQMAVKWKELGVTPLGTSVQKTGSFIEAERQRFTKLIETAGLIAD